MIEQRKNEAFGFEYDRFVSNLARNLNEKLWKNTSFIEESNVETNNFFDIYYQNFSM